VIEGKVVFSPPDGTHLILASSSPRRRELFKQIGINDFSIQAADVDERALVRELPNTYALRIARKKAETVSKKIWKMFCACRRYCRGLWKKNFAESRN
jgi:predicted house-cleaning NTP pyrophosphatase (Maf/HAM1 superfamily)